MVDTLDFDIRIEEYPINCLLSHLRDKNSISVDREFIYQLQEIAN
ncbi:Uncharacterised protein [Bacteroides uniformis]|uniref:Uncharacterized protein n=1 Tax=Bacteroides uniformis TaxID=820 RepID=A0A174SB99_BACUN|nr:Uncharacterised protein [Bacteroides uniformis]